MNIFNIARKFKIKNGKVALMYVTFKAQIKQVSFDLY